MGDGVPKIRIATSLRQARNAPKNPLLPRTGRSARARAWDNPKSQPRRAGDVGALEPSAHALFVTVGHSRPGRGGNRMDGRPAG